MCLGTCECWWFSLLVLPPAIFDTAPTWRECSPPTVTYATDFMHILLSAKFLACLGQGALNGSIASRGGYSPLPWIRDMESSVKFPSLKNRKISIFKIWNGALKPSSSESASKALQILPKISLGDQSYGCFVTSSLILEKPGNFQKNKNP